MAQDTDALVQDLHEARERFLALVADVRPDLHRYCARMTGSVSDGEDIVQDTLAYAYYAVSEVSVLPPLRSWLFQIAHHRAIDYLRRYERRMGRPLEAVHDTASDAAGSRGHDRAARSGARSTVSVSGAATRAAQLQRFSRTCSAIRWRRSRRWWD